MQEKEVISIATGLNYGHIVDVEIDNSGNILSFIVENKKFFRKSFDSGEKRFKYSEIEKIIIVDELVENWTYPLIQPKLIEEAMERGYL